MVDENGNTQNRIYPLIELTLDIARKYDNPEYLKRADRSSDVFHGSIFVYEMLKQSLKVEQLRAMLHSRKRELSEQARNVLDEIVELGIEEFSSSNREL